MSNYFLVCKNISQIGVVDNQRQKQVKIIMALDVEIELTERFIVNIFENYRVVGFGLWVSLEKVEVVAYAGSGYFWMNL